MKERQDEERSRLVPFLVGGLIGAGIALLLAPKSGEETREDIREIAEDARERISSAYRRGKELVDEGKTIVSSAIDAGKAAYVREKERHLKAA